MASSSKRARLDEKIDLVLMKEEADKMLLGVYQELGAGILEQNKMDTAWKSELAAGVFDPNKMDTEWKYEVQYKDGYTQKVAVGHEFQLAKPKIKEPEAQMKGTRFSMNIYDDLCTII
ncbi:Hypothetical predicted protein [Paramuricea clavata]|uniref:Uncharacterized protein n=1 Tax=Paramuricea clavata TaxID=317549 RepID=A0A7D9D6B2_PARCT|nr:Hypothetical predicted protein [Paramuricea clavata]